MSPLIKTLCLGLQVRSCYTGLVSMLPQLCILDFLELVNLCNEVVMQLLYLLSTDSISISQKHKQSYVLLQLPPAGAHTRPCMPAAAEHVS